MLELNDFNSQKSAAKAIVKWIILSIFVVMAFIYINNEFKYEDYTLFNAVATGDKNFSIILNIKDLKTLRERSDLSIGKEKIAYKIKEIKIDNIIVADSYYKEVILDLDYDAIENETLECRLLIAREDIFSYIFKKLQEGT